MSCEVCHGHPGCPVCQEADDMVECPTCNGSGTAAYYDGGFKEITRAEFLKLQPGTRYKDRCPHCKGEGEIHEYELEYDEEQ